MVDSDDDSTDGAVVRVPVGSANEGRARRLVDAAHDAAGGGVTVVETGPTGVDTSEPLVALTAGGRTTLHGGLTPDGVRTLVEAAADGDLGAERARSSVEHDTETDAFPTPDTGPLSVGRRRVLARAGWTDPTGVEADEPFAADRAADAGDEVRERLAEVGLLGRGRGDGAPDTQVSEEWEVARRTDGDPVVVVNGNEADPRNDTDRLLLESDPVAVLDGALAVAELVGADDVVVYLNEADDLARRRVHGVVNAVADAVDADHDTLPEIVAGPDRYIAGEPTMALESLEGNDRLEARLRPPTPARHGIYGRPTVIHTPRTLAQVRRAILSPEEYDPDDADPGTRLVSVTGDVDGSAVVEIPTGGSLATAAEAVGFEGNPKLAVVGGQFGGLTRTLDHPASAPGLRSADLGTAGVVELFDDGACALAAVGRRARFGEEENCGRCVPCREGSKQLTGMLRDIYDGEYRDAKLRELARVARESSTCSFGRELARTVLTGVDQFENEFAAHAEGRCPAGECGSEGHEGHT
ncbi:NADH-ubiquinone oxidoreductase-F iron-sulfur binding region domain-containing protein [Halobium salinum]|uniref:NADH-ubiquinone oxidoreductase-F iron-sulfur binding region domain-containing protein n=1 Tax=Halobium salinum TaxID=1364940 RepID=A0ABD5PCV2_9EURY|nr:NADH-ubiquinone oxidoreductase-F iron-sulfur binding region domain-containing protein [Halobium salinum]